MAYAGSQKKYKLECKIRQLIFFRNGRSLSADLELADQQRLRAVEIIQSGFSRI